MRLEALCLCVVWNVVCALLPAASAHAQTWSLTRQRPSLFEIIAVDATSDTGWPYGQEDVAGDGTSTREDDELAVDLRSLYADARAQRLWLRAYVAATSAPGASASAYFFIDSDTNTQTGGKAEDSQLWPRLSADPSPGGYERAIVMTGDGMLKGLFFWDQAMSRWVEQSNPASLVSAESGVARDPLRLVGNDHGYFQISLGLDTADLDDSCAAEFFVRTFHDGSANRRFGDHIDALAVGCHPQLNRFGDPVILRSDTCSSDASCPAEGRCREGICVFGYECTSDAACTGDRRCVNSVCVLVVDKTCSDSSMCDGLVCDASRCVACTESGARACASGLACSPDGRCLSPSGTGPGQAGRGGSGGAPGERVRGGAFSCSVDEAGSAAHALGALIYLAGATLYALRIGRRRSTRSRRAGRDR